MGAAAGGGKGTVPFAGRLRRRDLVRGLLAVAAVLALAPVVTVSRPRRTTSPGAPGRPGDAGFDEMYRGSRIRGVLAADERAAAAGTAGAAAARWRITVDGRPLHLMRRADGTYLSTVDHYRSFATALEATRAAVDELGAVQRLRIDGSEGHGHGVHA